VEDTVNETASDGGNNCCGSEGQPVDPPKRSKNYGTEGVVFSSTSKRPNAKGTVKSKQKQKVNNDAVHHY
jgi:hypothetical protein